MRDLFTTQPSNSHQVLLPLDFPAWQRLTANLHRSSLVEAWREPELKLQAADRRAVEVPNICTIYLPGAIAFRAELQDELLPMRQGLELLPLRVGLQTWLLVNCLNSAQRFDQARSNVMRGLNGEIFMIQWLAIDDRQESLPELFSLTESNRAQLFVQSSFKARVEQLQLEGISFQPIGSIS